jgi:hypothetical protein
MYPRPTADRSTLRAPGTVLAHPVVQSSEVDVTVVVNHLKLLIYNDLRFVLLPWRWMPKRNIAVAFEKNLSTAQGNYL